MPCQKIMIKQAKELESYEHLDKIIPRYIHGSYIKRIHCSLTLKIQVTSTCKSHYLRP